MTKRLSRRLNPKEILTLGLTFGQKVFCFFFLSEHILEQPCVGTHESAKSSPRNGFKQFPSALVLLAVSSLLNSHVRSR